MGRAVPRRVSMPSQRTHGNENSFPHPLFSRFARLCVSLPSQPVRMILISTKLCEFTSNLIADAEQKSLDKGPRPKTVGSFSSPP